MGKDSGHRTQNSGVDSVAIQRHPGPATATGDESRSPPTSYFLQQGSCRLRIAANIQCVAAFLMLVIAGCAEDGPPRYDVAGTVTYQGSPVPYGTIMFQPDPTQGNSGPTGSATIKDGTYNTKLEGEPQTGGPQIVFIEAFDGKIENPDYAPYGAALGESYQQRYELPQADTTLDIEMTLLPES